MFFKSDEVEYLKDCMFGYHDDEPMLMEFREFMKDEFDVRVYAFFVSSIIGYKGKSLRKLQFVVPAKDTNRFVRVQSTDPYGTTEWKIKEEFSRLCKKYNKYPEYLNPLDYFAVSGEFETELKREILSSCEYDLRALEKSIPEVNEIYKSDDTFHVFYNTNADIETCEKSGLSAEIKDKILIIVQKNDMYNVFKDVRVKYTSKQDFNETYQGNWYYYLK